MNERFITHFENNEATRSQSVLLELMTILGFYQTAIVISLHAVLKSSMYPPPIYERGHGSQKPPRQSVVKMQGFRRQPEVRAYMAYAALILFPLYILITLLFFLP